MRSFLLWQSLLDLEPLLDLAALLPPEREELDDLGFAALFAVFSSLHRMQYHLEGALASPMQGRWYQLSGSGHLGLSHAIISPNEPRLQMQYISSSAPAAAASSAAIGSASAGASATVSTPALDAAAAASSPTAAACGWAWDLYCWSRSASAADAEGPRGNA